MNHNRPTQRKPLTRIGFSNLPLALLLVVVVVAINGLFQWLNQDDALVNGQSLKEQAITQAQQAVRKQIGDGFTVKFINKTDVQTEGTSLYHVSSNAVATNRNGEQFNRPWMVTLQYQEGSDKTGSLWKVISCQVGQ